MSEAEAWVAAPARNDRKRAIRAAPWAVSVVFHAAMLVLLSMLYMFIADAADDEIIIPNARLAAEAGRPLQSDLTEPQLQDASIVAETTAERLTELPQAAPAEPPAEPDISEILGLGGGAGSGLDILSPPASEAGPKLFGTGGNAHHVVYVVDGSGSMVDSLGRGRNLTEFGPVRLELLHSIAELTAEQTFHVIFFFDTHLDEKRPCRLVSATDPDKCEAAKFLAGIVARGQTDPVPALKRAFEVLAQADRRKKGKLIYLLTDGQFPDNRKVLQTLAELNAGGKVQINTILLSYGLPEAERVLKQIAKANGGVYKLVGEDR
ncbi:MAG: VWA domain-containing protein [Planctomycetes bacterium]|nr:VWA domain-containing protein [Planctomycetota bacterium]